MGAAKRTLELDYDYHFYLLGIRSDLTGYHLAYFLNRDLKIGLRRSSRDLLLEGLKGAEPTCYTYFEFEELDMERDWFLAVNRGSQLMPAFDQGLFSGQEEAYRTSFLLPELKDFDYLLVVHGLMGPAQEERLKLVVRKASGVLASKSVDPEQLKHRDHLLFLDQ